MSAFKVQKYDTVHLAKPVGLVNSGQICWANSLMQVLWGLPAIWAENSSENKSSILYAALCKHAGQQDPVEHLTLLFDTCMQECAKFFKQVTHTEYDCKCGKLTSKDMAYIVDDSIFNGPCSTETMEACVVCGQCRVRKSAVVGLREIIIVECSERAARRIIPDKLIFNSTGGAVLTYILCGRIHYSGVRTATSSSGHYTASSLRLDAAAQQWYTFNDSSVKLGVDAQPTRFAFYHLV